MKRIYLLLFIFIGVAAFSQQQIQDYYVVVNSGSSIEPSQTSTMSDGRLSLTFSQTNINLNGFQVGNYSVTLICDGQIVESKNLIKN